MKKAEIAAFFSCLWVMQSMAAPAATPAPGLAELDAELVPVQASAPVICTARELRTMDPARPTASAVPVQDRRFLAVGSLAELSGRVRGATVDRRFASNSEYLT